VKQVSIYDAKTHLSSLVALVARGEEIVIAKNGLPLAKLVPLPNPLHPRRPAGAMGVTYIAPDFDETDADTVADFNGDH